MLGPTTENGNEKRRTLTKSGVTLISYDTELKFMVDDILQKLLCPLFSVAEQDPNVDNKLCRC